MLYPVLVSLAMFVMATTILYRRAQGQPLAVTRGDLLGWLAAAVVIVVSFCLAGLHVSRPDYAGHFHPLLFAAGLALGAATSARALWRSSAPALAEPS